MYLSRHTQKSVSHPQYIAVKGERVIGVVVKTSRVHKVDIGTAVLASLSELAFQGATRRNKPSLQVCCFTKL